MNYNLNKAYSFLETCSPLKFDCGKLCNKKCCHGSEKDGMLLFPGEEELFKGVAGFKITESAQYPQYKVLTCEGKCDRKHRPLACRMFPLFPYVFKTDDGKYILKVLTDVRADGYCPIADINKTERSFVRSVRLAAQALLREEKYKKYLFELTELLTSNPF